MATVPGLRWSGNECPRCGARLYTDGRWEFCQDVDVCGYSRAHAEAEDTFAKEPAEQPAKEHGG